jgi:cytochrome c551/c552
MEKVIQSILLTGAIIFCFSLQAQSEGETLFKTTCTACHKLSNARLVGPGLANVHKKRSEEWIINFVKSSQTLINSGDADAVAIFEEYNKIVMPDQPFTDDQIRGIINYIAENSPDESEMADNTTEPEEPEIQFSEKDIIAGQNLFVGKINLSNGGPTCNSCHNVTNDNVLTGGALAKDLTAVYDRMGAAGIMAILNNPPFPAMNQSYAKHKITEQEITQLTAFLKDANETRLYQHDRKYGQRMLYTGIIGALIIMGLFPLIWFKRKSNSVNKRIYDRQKPSAN